MLHVLGAGKTDVGRIRKRNEDAWLVDERRNLFLVADGLGGHASGDVASKITVDTIGRLMGRAIDICGDNSDIIRKAFIKAVEVADVSINEAIYRDPSKKNMASTLVACAIQGQTAVVAHVGDSRAYLVRDGQIRQIDRDHSWVADQVAIGILTPSEADNHPYRNIVTRALGNGTGCEPSVDIVQIEPGDRFILCSDGLSGLVRDEDIQGFVIRSSSPGDCVDVLVQTALQNGGNDNVTVIAIFCEEA